MSGFFTVLGRRWVTFVTLLVLGSVALALAVAFTAPHPVVAHEEAPTPAVPEAPREAGQEEGRRLDQRLELLRKKQEALQVVADSQAEQLQDRERRMKAVNASAAEIERRTQETRLRQDRSRSRLRLLEADEHRFRESLPAGDEADSLTSPVLDRVRAEMNKVRGEIALGGLERTPGSPEYKKLAARLAELEDSLRGELYRARAETIVMLRNSIRELDDDLRDLDEQRLRKILEVKSLAEDIRELSPVLADLAAVRKEMDSIEAMKERLAHAPPEPARTVVAAPREPSREPRFPVGWGAVAVVLIAVAGAFWRDAADPRVRTDADVKRRLNLPTIAMVEDAGNDPLLFRRHPTDPLSEAMSTAATVVRSYLAEREFRTMAVTSARAGEGKTTTAMNLACAMARKGLSVLLVDADLRAPRVHEIYGLDNLRGLSTILLGPEPAEPEMDPDQIIIQTEIPTLRILPSGPTNEIVADLQDSPRMIDFLKTQRERYDLIILDAAPLTGVGDAVALSRVVDTCLWVVRAGSSDRRTLGWAKHLLKTVRADVAGVVLNFSPSAAGERFYAYPKL